MNQLETDFRQTLKSIYQGQDKIAQLIEGLDEIPEQSLNDYYIKLQMLLRPDDQKTGGYESVSGEKKEITLADLFEKISDDPTDKAPEKILILGGAGVGKSTLLQYIAFKWGSSQLWDEKFDYIYRISLKTMLNPEWKSSPWQYEADELNDSLLKCLVHYSITLPLPFKEKRKITTQSIPWIGDAGKKILLILDGYDEVAHLKDKPDIKMVFEEIFEFKNVILTSRPNALNTDIRANFDRIIENTGLDNKGIEEYFDRYFKDDKKKKEELLIFLGTQAFIKEICKIPVNIAMLCYIWQYSESSERLQQISNASLLYQQILSHLGYRYLQKKFESTNSSKLNQLKELIYNGELTLDELKVINYTGYKAMTGGGISVDEAARVETLIIQGALNKSGKVDLADKDNISILSSVNYLSSISEIKNTPEDKVTIKQLYKYGLLKTEAAASTSSSVKTLSETDLQKMNFSFIHLTFQEFCTAYYLKERLQRGNEQEKNDICRFLAEHRNEPRYLMTLKFMTGIIMADKGKDNHLVIKLFWDSMTCNVDGLVEFGIETKAVLMMHLLGQSCERSDNLPQVDPRVPNTKEIVDFIDAVALKDLSRLHHDILESDYVTENIIEGILKALTDESQDWHINKMKEIAERSPSGLKASINIMIKVKQEQIDREKEEPQKMKHQKFIRAIEMALSFLNIGKNKEFNQEYGLRIIRDLLSILFNKCKKEDFEVIEALLQGITRVLSKVDLSERLKLDSLFDEFFANRQLLDFNKVIGSFLGAIVPKVEDNAPILRELVYYFFNDKDEENLRRLKANLMFNYLSSEKIRSKNLILEIYERLFPLATCEEFKLPSSPLGDPKSNFFKVCSDEILIERFKHIAHTFVTIEVEPTKKMFFLKHIGDFSKKKIMMNVPNEVKIPLLRKIFFYSMVDKDEEAKQELTIGLDLLHSIEIENEDCAAQIFEAVLSLFTYKNDNSVAKKSEIFDLYRGASEYSKEDSILMIKNLFIPKILQPKNGKSIFTKYGGGLTFSFTSSLNSEYSIEHFYTSCQEVFDNMLQGKERTNETDINQLLDLILKEIYSNDFLSKYIKLGQIISGKHLSKNSIIQLCAKGMFHHISRDQNIAIQCLKGFISLLKLDKKSAKDQAIAIAEKIAGSINDNETISYIIKNILPILSRKNDDIRIIMMIALDRLTEKCEDKELVLKSIKKIILCLDDEKSEFRKYDIIGFVDKNQNENPLTVFQYTKIDYRSKSEYSNCKLVATDIILGKLERIKDKELIRRIISLLNDHYSSKSKIVRLSVLNILNIFILNLRPDKELLSTISPKSLISLLEEKDPEMLLDLIFQINTISYHLTSKELAFETLKNVIPMLSPETEGLSLMIVPLTKMIRVANDKELATQIMPLILSFFFEMESENGEISDYIRLTLEVDFLSAVFEITKDKEPILEAINKDFKDLIEYLPEAESFEMEEMELFGRLFEFIEEKESANKFLQQIISDIPNYKNGLEQNCLIATLVRIAKTSEGENLIPQIIDMLSQVQDNHSIRCWALPKLFEITKNEDLITQTLQKNIDSLGGYFIWQSQTLIMERKELLVQSLNKILLDLKDSDENKTNELEILSNLTCKALELFGATELTLEAYAKIDAMIKRLWMSKYFYHLEKSVLPITKVITTLIFNKKDLFEYLNLPSEKFTNCLIDQLAERLARLRDKFKVLREVLRNKNSLSVEIINEQLFDNSLDEAVKNKIAKQVQEFNQDKSDQNLETLKTCLIAKLNWIGTIKAHEVVEIALKLIGYENSSTNSPNKKKLVDISKEILELQAEHLNEEGVDWLGFNLESLMKLSNESKTFLRKVFHKLLRDCEITPKEEILIIKLINYGFTTSMTRKGELIFEGKKYRIKIKSIEELFERISQTIISLEQDALAPQYQQHEPIFNKSVDLGIKRASCDVKKVFSLFEKSFELSNDKWLLTKLAPKEHSEHKLLMEHRNTFGDYLIYDLINRRLIKINPLDIDKELEGLFGPFNPSSPIRYNGQSKEMESKTGYEVLSKETDSTLCFGEISGSQPSEEKIYFQRKLLNKGDDDNHALLTSELDKKVDDQEKKLQDYLKSLTFLDKSQKLKLTDYYKAFLRTFTDVYTTAQVIESGQVAVDAGSTFSVGLVSTILTFIPVIGDKLASGLDSMDKFMKNQEMINSARKMKSFASSHVELYQIASNSAIDIIKDQAKQSQIMAAMKKEDFDVLDQSISGKLTDTLKTEIVKMMGTKIYADTFSTPAAELGNHDAKKVIQNWINDKKNDITAERSKEDMKKEFVNVVTQKDKEDVITKNESLCLNPCQKGGCNLF